MAFVLSVGFAVEYSVHIVARFLKADIQLETGLDRVKYTMSRLMLPTVMSFGASLIGVICLAFTEFDFNFTFFFKPLIILMFVTYFYGCWWLPAMLTLVNWDIVKFGQRGALGSSDRFSEDSIIEQAEAPLAKNSHAAADVVEDLHRGAAIRVGQLTSLYASQKPQLSLKRRGSDLCTLDSCSNDERMVLSRLTAVC